MTIDNRQQDNIERQDQDKQFHIIVNGRPKTVPSDELTFDEVVRLAFDPPPTGRAIMFAITYRDGGGRPPEGSLAPGVTVKVKDGTVFNVTATDKS